MSITFYVQDWDKQPSKDVKSYVSEQYPTLTEEEIDIYFSGDPAYFKDKNGYYEIKTIYKDEFPELQVSNANACSILKALGFVYTDTGEFPVEQLSEVISQSIKLINSKNKLSKNVRKTIREKRFVSFGIDENYYIDKILKLLEILKFAQKEKKRVYWG